MPGKAVVMVTAMLKLAIVKLEQQAIKDTWQAGEESDIKLDISNNGGQ